jgi:hypothetical protein
VLQLTTYERGYFMPEELSPQSKLYVKEEIEKSRKEFREDVEKVKSKTTKTFTTAVIVVGFLTGMGVYGLAVRYMDAAISKGLEDKGIAELKSKAEGLVIEAEGLVEEVNIHAEQAQESSSRIAEIENDVPKKIIVGTIVPYGGKIVEKRAGARTEVGEEWLFCNGVGLDRAEYKDLFDVIGVAFGEPDDSTFNLPDLRGRFVRGVDHGQKRDPDAQPRKASNKGGNTGDKVGSLQEDAHGSHHHLLEKSIYEHYRSFQGSKQGSDKPLKSSKGDTASEEWSRRTNVSGGKETRPKNIYVNWIIKAR